MNICNGCPTSQCSGSSSSEVVTSSTRRQSTHQSVQKSCHVHQMVFCCILAPAHKAKRFTVQWQISKKQSTCTTSIFKPSKGEDIMNALDNYRHWIDHSIVILKFVTAFITDLLIFPKGTDDWAYSAYASDLIIAMNYLHRSTLAMEVAVAGAEHGQQLDRATCFTRWWFIFSC